MSKSKKILGFKFKNDYLNVFFLGLILAVLMFLPFIIMDKGYFFYYGDFNAQQIPFYKLAHDAVLSGNVGWNWNTDLGANFIGSYSFYLLGSPFFWLTLLFPSNVVPFLMAPLLILKFAFAGVTGFAFIKRFTLKTEYAVLGAMLYAFSGFNLYNIFFNHFHEAVIVFPLLLIALEELILNNRRGLFALAVCACAITNYYFFFGQVFFTVFYFLIRCTCTDFKDALTVRKIIAIGFEAVIGVLMSCVLLLPAVLAIMGNPRTSEYLSGYHILLYGTQRYCHIMQSLFFPPDIPAKPNFFPESSAKWSSLAAYLPLFGMVGVLAFFKNFKKHWIKKLLILSLICALVPIFNSIFSAFTASYYARWFYMPILIMSLATVLVLEKADAKFKSSFIVCGVIFACFSVLGFLPSVNEDGVWGIGNIIPFPRRFWTYIAIAVFSTVAVALIIKYFKKRQSFIRVMTLAVSIAILVNSWCIMAMGREHSETAEQLTNQLVNGIENIHIYDKEFYRINTDSVIDNAPMHWKMPSIQCFHSIVPVSVIEFYDTIGYDRNVASRPETDYYGLCGLASVKYLFCDNEKSSQPYVPGFVYYDMQNDCTIYENTCFIPMGFTYDKYMSSETLESFEETSRDKVMLHAVLLNDEDIAKYSYLMDEFTSDELYTVNEVSYFDDCADRKETAGYYFAYDNSGFTSKISLDKESLVFYSVPYDEGWTAYVNGTEAEILKVNAGFMAVVAPIGDNEIVFKYETPGLKTGILLTVTATIVLIIYMGFVLYMRKKNRKGYELKKNSHRETVSVPQNILAGDAYINSVVKKSLDKLDDKQKGDKNTNEE